MGDLDDAVRAIGNGELVVYPTETVYGLGADARSTAAIDRVFALKRRDRDNPLSIAVPNLESLDGVAAPTPETLAFMEAFLPGPVTVVCAGSDRLPDALTAGADRIGIRIPTHPLAEELLDRIAPLTATSANPSGGSPAHHPRDLDPTIRAGVAVVLDGGRSEGAPSTVVDVDRRIIHRRGQFADAVEAWLDERDDQSPSP